MLADLVDADYKITPKDLAHDLNTYCNLLIICDMKLTSILISLYWLHATFFSWKSSWISESLIWAQLDLHQANEQLGYILFHTTIRFMDFPFLSVWPSSFSTSWHCTNVTNLKRLIHYHSEELSDLPYIHEITDIHDTPPKLQGQFCSLSIIVVSVLYHFPKTKWMIMHFLLPTKMSLMSKKIILHTNVWYLIDSHGHKMIQEETSLWKGAGADHSWNIHRLSLLLHTQTHTLFPKYLYNPCPPSGNICLIENKKLFLMM